MSRGTWTGHSQQEERTPQGEDTPNIVARYKWSEFLAHFRHKEECDMQRLVMTGVPRENMQFLASGESCGCLGVLSRCNFSLLERIIHSKNPWIQIFWQTSLSSQRFPACHGALGAFHTNAVVSRQEKGCRLSLSRRLSFLRCLLRSRLISGLLSLTKKLVHTRKPRSDSWSLKNWWNYQDRSSYQRKHCFRLGWMYGVSYYYQLSQS